MTPWRGTHNSCGNRSALGFAIGHVKPHLVIGNVLSRQGVSSWCRKHHCRTFRDHQRARSLTVSRRHRPCNSGRATPSLRYKAANISFLILIVAVQAAALPANQAIGGDNLGSFQARLLSLSSCSSNSRYATPAVSAKWRDNTCRQKSQASSTSSVDKPRRLAICDLSAPSNTRRPSRIRS